VLTTDSIPHSSCPLTILKNPFSPQLVPQELAIIQYLIPSSVTPHPIILIACPPKFSPVIC